MAVAGRLVRADFPLAVNLSFHRHQLPLADLIVAEQRHFQIGDDRIVEDLCCRGIEGLEVFYPQHDEADTARYLDMAKRYQLLVTGGSDYHGFATRYPQALGVFTIDDCWAEKLYRPIQKL